jgi:CCR4-NOT transcription complex subunit 1
MLLALSETCSYHAVR